MDGVVQNSQRCTKWIKEGRDKGTKKVVNKVRHNMTDHRNPNIWATARIKKTVPNHTQPERTNATQTQKSSQKLLAKA